MILVTGANGHLGRQTIQFLLSKGIPAGGITAFVRHVENAKDLAEIGLKIAIGDYNDYASLVAAFSGIEKILLVSGSDLPTRFAQHENVLKAAKYVNVKHVIYTSGANSIATPDSLLWSFIKAHIETEKILQNDGFTYTILRNSLYLDIIPLFIGNVLETGMIYLPAGDGRIGMALRSEMAEAAAEVLSKDGHENKVYNLVNTETYSYSDVAKYLSEISSKTIKYVSPGKDEFLNTLSEAGIDMPEEYVNILLAQANGEGDFTSQDLAKLIGRQPTTLKQFLTQVYQ